MNTRPQQSEGSDRPGQGRRAGDCFAGYSGNGAEPFLGERVEKCNESESVYCRPVHGFSLDLEIVSRNHRRKELQGLRANARRPLPKSHHGAFREGFTNPPARVGYSECNGTLRITVKPPVLSRRYRGVNFNEHQRGDEVAELAKLKSMGGCAREDGPRSEAIEPTKNTAYGCGTPKKSAPQCWIAIRLARVMRKLSRSRQPGECGW